MSAQDSTKRLFSECRILLTRHPSKSGSACPPRTARSGCARSTQRRARHEWLRCVSRERRVHTIPGNQSRPQLQCRRLLQGRRIMGGKTEQSCKQMALFGVLASHAGPRRATAALLHISNIQSYKYKIHVQAQARGSPTNPRPGQAEAHYLAFGHGRDASPTKYWSVGVDRRRFTRRTGRLHPRA